MKARLSDQQSIKSLSHSDLELIAERFGNNARLNRAELLRYLATKACEGEHEDDIIAFVDRVLALDAKKVKSDIDPLTETVFGELEADDKKEHGEIAKAIAEKGLKRKTAYFKEQVDRKRRRLAGLSGGKQMS